MYPSLSTKRLTLRPFTADDAAAMLALCSNPKQTEPVDWPLSATPQKAGNFLQRIINCGMYWAIVWKPDNKVIGAYGCSHAALPAAKKRDNALIWLTLLEEYWRQGIAAEATEAVCRFAFADAKVTRLFSRHHPGHPAAEALLRKCGFTPCPAPTKADEIYVYYIFSDEEIAAQQHMAADTYDYHMPEPVQSVYSFSNPIRQIHSIRLQEQPTEYLCGQAVIAMLADVPVYDVVAVMQNEKGASTPDMRAALMHYGIRTAKRIPYTDGAALPECCILSLKLPGYGHWSLYYKGQFFDPEFGMMTEIPAQAKLRYVWEVII